MKFNTKDRNIFFCSDPHYSHRNLIKSLTNWKDSMKVVISDDHEDIFRALKKLNYKVERSQGTTIGYIEVDLYDESKIRNISSNYFSEFRDAGAIRDYKSLDHHNDTLVNNINKTVGIDDVLFILGDVAFSGVENVKSFMDRILCREVHLIFGNHDEHIIANRNNVKNCFTTTSFYREVMIDSDMFVLFHYPINEWNGAHKGWYHCYGHQHNLPADKFSNVGRSFDCGFDGHPEFRPYNVKTEIIPLLKDFPILQHH